MHAWLASLEGELAECVAFCKDAELRALLEVPWQRCRSLMAAHAPPTSNEAIEREFGLDDE